MVFLKDNAAIVTPPLRVSNLYRKCAKCNVHFFLITSALTMTGGGGCNGIPVSTVDYETGQMEHVF